MITQRSVLNFVVLELAERAATMEIIANISIPRFANFLSQNVHVIIKIALLYISRVQIEADKVVLRTTITDIDLILKVLTVPQDHANALIQIPARAIAKSILKIHVGRTQ